MNKEISKEDQIILNELNSILGGMAYFKRKCYETDNIKLLTELMEEEKMMHQTIMNIREKYCDTIEEILERMPRIKIGYKN